MYSVTHDTISEAERFLGFCTTMEKRNSNGESPVSVGPSVYHSQQFFSDKKVEQHRKHESELRAKVEEQKGIEMQLNSRLAVLQNKLDLLGSNSDSELLDSYKLQNEHLRNEIEDVRAEIKNVSFFSLSIWYHCYANA